MYEEQKVERKKRIYLSGTDLRDRDHGILMAVAVPSYSCIQEKSAKQVAISNARANYMQGKAQQEMVDAGVLADSETEAYNYDASEDKATWEGEIGKKSYKAEYSGKTGEGYILSDDNGTDR